MVEDIPLDIENIKEKQDEDKNLQQSLTKHPTWHSLKSIDDVNDILCYTKPGDNAANWKKGIAKRLNSTHYQVVSSSHRASWEQKVLSTHTSTIL